MDVKIWQEPVTIPTYEVGKPNANPMFFENRVYQGSSGVVYPYPIIETISDQKVDREYTGLFLENKYLKIMVLPQLGGRVQMAYDKVAQRHFVYYNQVIKPALVGLCGPWISGGIEFNWPQHHRPTTFHPVGYSLEEHPDGSKTVWVSEVERMYHTKGMAGFTLYPDKAYLEITAKVYNRTPLPQTFLWWANPAVRVNEHYQSVFPPDVNAVFDHGKRDVSSFPIATGTYYKIDYAPGTDISKYQNIPVPTSYMAVNSNYDFVGGYEHDSGTGVLHVADHHVSPGKKQWTWGNGDFGMAWNRNLTDEDGPYIELMTGMYTDNQPDFSWLMPYEEKAFTQYFLPYREVGLVKNASKDFLMGLMQDNDRVIVHVFATSAFAAVKVKLLSGTSLLLEKTVDLSPTELFCEAVQVGEHVDAADLRLLLAADDGNVLLAYEPQLNKKYELPPAAQSAPESHAVESTEQLFLIGQHLEQYRHATYDPVAYYTEGLRRDPNDVRNNNALGKWYLRRGRFEVSEPYFRKAIATITSRNPNPYDSEPLYNLALSLWYRGKLDDAYDAFYKAAWSGAWQDSAYFSLAQIDVGRGDFDRAMWHVDWAIDRNARNGKAQALKTYILRKTGDVQQGIDVAMVAIKRDRFNLGALFELYFSYRQLGQDGPANDFLRTALERSLTDSHNLIDYAIDYAAFGAYQEAIAILAFAIKGDKAGKNPLVYYYTAYYWMKCGDSGEAQKWCNKATEADGTYCFPNRLEDIAVLTCAMAYRPDDARASYFLGNLWYDKRQYDQAILCWEKAVSQDPGFPSAYRNLAIAAFNKQDDKQKALTNFERAFALDTSDARVLMELDQLYKRLNHSPDDRLENLERWADLVESRDDLYLEVATLYNRKGQHQKALNHIMNRKFHPWEGGEGKVSSQYIYSLVELAKEDLDNSRFLEAIDKLKQAQVYPQNLGEGKLPGAQENDLLYWMGCAYEGLGDTEQASLLWEKATIGQTEPTATMFYNDQQPDKIFYQGLAWQKLGEQDRAGQVFRKLVTYGTEHAGQEVKIDYFAVSLPDLLTFNADLNERHRLHCLYIAGLGFLGMRDTASAYHYLTEVLKSDSMHFGAYTHLKLLDRSQLASEADNLFSQRAPKK